MSNDLKKVILTRLSLITPPGMREDILTAGLIKIDEISVGDDGKVIVPVNIPAGYSGDVEALQATVQERLENLAGITSLMVIPTAEREATPAPTPELPKLRKRPTEAPGPDMRPAQAAIPGIHNIIAVASGKGGVGKSTTAVNLALGLRALGLRVGLLDADIYGPSMPRLLGTDERPGVEDDRIVPIDRYGIKAMSIGFLMDEESPVIWRGPMVVSALMQMSREVAWGELDVLVLDMPPGTGDAQLTMAQQVPLQGAIIVSTPQDLALIDARKGLKMFKNVDVPIFGIIENMSTFICPHCGKPSDIFGHGGAEADAHRLGVPFLGAVPLHMAIREYSDAGTPVVAAEPQSPHAQAYRDLALKVASRLFPQDEDDD